MCKGVLQPPMEPLFDAVYFGVPNMMPRSDAELFADLPNRGGSGLEVYEPDHTCLSGEEVGIYYYDTDRTVYFADFTWVEPEEEEEKQASRTRLQRFLQPLRNWRSRDASRPGIISSMRNALKGRAP